MATRRHGQHGALYVDVSSAGNSSASLVATLSEHSVSFAADKVDVTAYEDTNKTYVQGKPDANGSFKGFLDTASDQLYYAASGGQARKFYHYIDTTNEANKYYYGTGIFDFTVSQKVDGAIEISGNWAAATAITRTWA